MIRGKFECITVCMASRTRSYCTLDPILVTSILENSPKPVQHHGKLVQNQLHINGFLDQTRGPEILTFKFNYVITSLANCAYDCIEFLDFYCFFKDKPKFRQKCQLIQCFTFTWCYPASAYTAGSYSISQSPSRHGDHMVTVQFSVWLVTVDNCRQYGDCTLPSAAQSLVLPVMTAQAVVAI